MDNSVLVRNVPGVLVGLTRNVGDQRSEYSPERRLASEITDRNSRWCPTVASTGRSHIPPIPLIVRFGNPGVPPDRGFLVFATTVRDAEAG